MKWKAASAFGAARTERATTESRATSVRPRPAIECVRFRVRVQVRMQSPPGRRSRRTARAGTSYDKRGRSGRENTERFEGPLRPFLEVDVELEVRLLVARSFDLRGPVRSSEVEPELDVGDGHPLHAQRVAHARVLGDVGIRIGPVVRVLDVEPARDLKVGLRQRDQTVLRSVVPGAPLVDLA